ncbi:Tol-Pal system beta propeller repeat protein TolB [Candidatus Coxiella mudrowiae]|uniref:Tol-Pal system beta propeller repeat protein TolB n=1 Tax=Candidatus Coxiella mudrowiae TaxID=2054173 RepID=UPI000C29007A|nr:Tol-Pal system beta propeller repeat protein TolB [Candidatus Coxiella mudrowiae]
MRKQYRLAFYILASLFFIPAYGALDLELIQGMTSAIPIAIAPFAGTSVSVPGDQTILQVIKNDLQKSGQFRVMGPDNLGQTPESVQEVNYSYWRKQKVNAVVIGAIRPSGINHYQVTFTLVNVFDLDNVLLSDSFNVRVQNLRSLAHHISDLIYQKLTGVRGVFPTRIAYVLVQRSPDKPPVYTLEVADADGFNPQPLLVSHMPIMSPTWSPDGKKIAYVSFEGQHAAIYMQNLSTGQRKRISDAPGINGAPAFSPNGTCLALVLTKTGNPNIYVLNLATKQLREIINDWAIDTEPAWSPDGKILLFTSNRDGTPQIYKYSFSDNAITRLTYRGDYNARASFFPDGKSIVMMHRENGLFGIAYEDLTTGRLQILTQSGADESPSLAPNGKMIIYATEYGGQGVLAQVSINGQVKLRFPSREGIVQEPAWSPFLG